MKQSIDISILRKKLLYRSLHRGYKETDLLLERFALNYLNQLSIEELIEYEKIINLDDYDLYNFITNKKKLPCNFSKKFFTLMAN